MNNNEWSLVSFTLLTQFSIGVWLMLTLAFYTNQPQNNIVSTGFNLRSAEFFILLTIIIATVISLLHLGSPLHAVNSMNNLSGSWISKEILLLILFGTGVLIIVLGKWLNWSASVLHIFYFLSCITGVFLLISMAGIYMISTVPSWNSWHTPVSFFLAMAIMGIMGIILITHLKNPEQLSSNFYSNLILILIVLCIAELIVSGVHQFELVRMEFSGIEEISFNTGWFFKAFILRTILMALACIVALILLIRISGITNHTNIIIILLGLIILQEIIGRLLFFHSYFRIGV